MLLQGAIPTMQERLGHPVLLFSVPNYPIVDQEARGTVYDRPT